MLSSTLSLPSGKSVRGSHWLIFRWMFERKFSFLSHRYPFQLVSDRFLRWISLLSVVFINRWRRYVEGGSLTFISFLILVLNRSLWMVYMSSCLLYSMTPSPFLTTGFELSINSSSSTWTRSTSNCCWNSNEPSTWCRQDSYLIAQSSGLKRSGVRQCGNESVWLRQPKKCRSKRIG